MMRFIPLILAVASLLGLVGRLAIESTMVQDRVLEIAAPMVVNQAAGNFPRTNSLQAYVCGSASPLPAPGRAQACIAVITPHHFYIVDAGARSSAKVMEGGLPMDQLQGILLTHLHSDHIAEVPEMNLNSWVAGRPAPLVVRGPEGVENFVSALNSAYELDREYRVTHHGADLLPPALGVMESATVAPGIILDDGDMRITAYVADHAPVAPAFGYRFDYRGRSIVVSGDSNVTAETIAISHGADLLLHDALSEPMVSALSKAARDGGFDRNAQILTDILDYHAWTSALVELSEQANIGMVAYYHMVPAPRNYVMERIFLRDAPDYFLVTRDGDSFELPVGTAEINLYE